jgi:hypothetical protein
VINFYAYHAKGSELLLHDDFNPLMPLLFDLEPGMDKLYDPDGGSALTPEYLKSTLAPVLHIIKRDPWLAAAYAIEVLNSRWEEAEPIILTDCDVVIMYAEKLLNERWPECEPLIMKEPSWAERYARKVIKGRWLEAERYILISPFVASKYAFEVVKGRWEDFEYSIIHCTKKGASGLGLFNYLWDLHKQGLQWIEGEQYLMENHIDDAVHYARYVLKRRWLEAEPYIMKDQNLALVYATALMDERWLELEKSCDTKSYHWEQYCDKFNVSFNYLHAFI